jgi:hypothetical protein
VTGVLASEADDGIAVTDTSKGEVNLLVIELAEARFWMMVMQNKR